MIKWLKKGAQGHRNSCKENVRVGLVVNSTKSRQVSISVPPKACKALRWNEGDRVLIGYEGGHLVLIEESIFRAGEDTSLNGGFTLVKRKSAGLAVRFSLNETNDINPDLIPRPTANVLHSVGRYYGLPCLNVYLNEEERAAAEKRNVQMRGSK